MYTLFYSPGTASLAVHWMLIELGVPFELARVDFSSEGQKQADYLALNPKGQVPTLVVEGRAVSESAAILMLLAERHPEAGLAPAVGTPERAEYLETMIYLANGLLPAFRNWFYVDDYATPVHHEDSLVHARARIEAVFANLDGRFEDGRAFLVGSRLSAADFLLVMLARWSRNMPKPADSWPRLGAYLARIKRTPSLREVHVREGLSDWL